MRAVGSSHFPRLPYQLEALQDRDQPGRLWKIETKHRQPVTVSSNTSTSWLIKEEPDYIAVRLGLHAVENAYSVAITKTWIWTEDEYAQCKLIWAIWNATDQSPFSVGKEGRASAKAELRKERKTAKVGNCRGAVESQHVTNILQWQTKDVTSSICSRLF